MPNLMGLPFKIGVATGLVNTNTKGDSLAHCVSQLNAKAVIVSGSFTKSITEAGIAGDLPNEDIILFAPSGLGTKRTTPEELSEVSFVCLTEVLKECPKTPPPRPVEGFSSSDKVLYVYTSGTTGLPKVGYRNNALAANLNFRFAEVLMFLGSHHFPQPLCLYFDGHPSVFEDARR